MQAHVYIILVAVVAIEVLNQFVLSYTQLPVLHGSTLFSNMSIYSDWLVKELLHFKTCFDCLVVTLKLQMFENHI